MRSKYKFVTSITFPQRPLSGIFLNRLLMHFKTEETIFFSYLYHFFTFFQFHLSRYWSFLYNDMFLTFPAKPTPSNPFYLIDGGYLLHTQVWYWKYLLRDIYLMDIIKEPIIRNVSNAFKASAQLNLLTFTHNLPLNKNYI